jgi:elongation factor G
MANVPMAELFDYSSSLRSISQGRAKFKMTFEEYVVVPYETQRKLVDEYSRTAKEEV